MAQVTFNTDNIIKGMLVTFAVIVMMSLAVCGVIGTLYLLDNLTPNTTPPNPVTKGIESKYPTVLTFTVLSTTTSNGHYQATTTVGNVLYFLDFATWNMMQPRSTYTVTITGYDGFAYYVGDVNLINRPVVYHERVYEVNDLPRYYFYLGKYYQCDGLACEMVPYKSVVNENVRRETTVLWKTI